MPNEEEVIVDPNNEPEKVETPENPPEVQPEKPAETPEDRASRLLRQTNQARKKLGLPPVGEVKPEAQNNQPNDPQLSEELKLIARGLSDEEIEQAKVIARGKGVSLAEATKDPLFLIYQGDLAEKERKEKARLGASKGSGESPQGGPEFKSGMTRDEHREEWKKGAGK